MSPDVFNRIQEHFESRPIDEKVRILGEFIDFESFDHIKLFVQGITLNVSKVKRLEKYAMVSDKRWFEKILKMERKLIPGIEFKYFPIARKKEAINWLKED